MDVKERYEFLMIELKNSGLEDVASQVESSMHAGSGIKTWSGDEIKRFISYGYSLDWLFRGVGEMRINDKEAPGSSKTEIPTRTTSFERLTEFNKEFKAASTHDPIRVVKHVLKIHPPKYKGEIIQEVIDSIEKELSKDYDSFITGLNPKY